MHPAQTGPAHLAGGFTLIERLVVIAIIAILAAIRLPALAAAKQRAIRIQCTSNLHQIAIAVQAYAGESGDKLPPLNPHGSAAWAWDIPYNASEAMLTAARLIESKAGLAATTHSIFRSC